MRVRTRHVDTHRSGRYKHFQSDRILKFQLNVMLGKFSALADCLSEII